MLVKLDLPDDLRRYAGGHSSFELPGKTAGDVIAALLAQYPDLRPRLLSRRGELFPYLPLFLNGQKLSPQNFASTPVEHGDRLEFVVLVSGG